MSVVEVRKARQSDIEAMVEIGRRFTEETRYGVAFDDEKALVTFSQYLLSPDCDILLAEAGGRLLGGAMLAEADEFQAKPFCYITKFFILPEGRGTYAARNLLQSIRIWAEHRGCSHVFSTATAGLSEREQRLFVNLMKRDGYRDVGPVLSVGS